MSGTQNGEENVSAFYDVDSMSTEERKELGAVIKAAREQQGLTRQQLCKQAGVDRTTLRTVETQERAAHADSLRKLLEALSIPQKSDAEVRYSSRTRMFIASVAPIFDKLPEAAQLEAQHDVTILLTGRLARTAGKEGVVSSIADYRNRNDSGPGETEQPDQDRIAAFEGKKIKRRKDDSEFFE